MRIVHWLRIGAPFLAGCFAGLCLALGTFVAVRLGMAAYDDDWGYSVLLLIAAACFLIGGGLVIINGLELH